MSSIAPKPNDARKLTFATSGYKIYTELVKEHGIKKHFEKFITTEKENLEKLKLQSKQEGFHEGYKEGSLKAFEDLINITYARNEAIRNLDTFVTGVVNEVCREVIGDELAGQPDTILKRVQRALDSVVNDQNNDSLSTIQIKINPGDVERISPMIQSQYSNIRIIPDDEIAIGDARIETPYGKLESEPFTHLENILSYLKRTLKNHPEYINSISHSMEMAMPATSEVRE